MTEDPLERFEDLIVNELCAYQAWLDSADPTGTARGPGLEDTDSLPAGSPDPEGSDSLVPAELRRSLDEFRHCLDVLHQVRIQADSDASKSAHTVVATPIDYRVGSSLRNSPVAPYWSVEELTDSGLPSRIGRFQIRRRLGTGGFGIVFLGFDPVARRERAIKIPRPEFLGSLHLMERFQREVAAVAPLDHPNIVPVLESSFYGVTPYIVMPYVSDITLAGWRASQLDISPRDAAEIVRQLADGMAHAHERGVLHRDVKPGNVLLASRASKVAHGSEATNGTEGGVLPFVPRLTDFGMAKQAATEISEELQQTRTGTVIGTICYMSPEQAEGRNKDITARSDVYGLGATLFELLTGAPPYRGRNDLQTLQNISRNEPLTLQSPGIKPISQDLQVICLKALEKDPRKRFDSAAELSGELDRYLRGLPIHSRPIAPIERCWRWARRRPALAGLISLFIAFVSLVLINNATKQRDLIAYNRELERLNRQSKAASERASQMQQIAEQNARKAMDTAYASDMGRVPVAWRQGDSRTMVELLDRYIPQEGEEDRRGFEWWYLRRQIIAPGRLLLDTGAAVYVLRQPSQKLMATSGADSTVRLFNPDTGEVLKEIVTGQGEINGTVKSGTDKLFATAGDDGTIRVLNNETWEERLRIETPLPKVYGVRVSRDGSQLIACGTAPFICAFDTSTGKELYRLEGHKRTVQNIEVSGNGLLFSNSNDGSIRVWNLNTRQNIGTFQSDFNLGAFVLQPGGKYLAAGTTTGAVLIVDADATKLVSSIVIADGIGALAFDPSGTRLAIGDASGRIIIRTIHPDGRIDDENLAAWQGHRSGITAFRWRYIVDELVSGDREGKIFSWNLSEIDSKQIARFPVPSKAAPEPFSSRPLNVSLRSDLLQSDNESVRLPPRQPDKLYRQFCFSSDGHYLAAVTESGALKLFLTPDDPTFQIDGNRIAALSSGNQTEIVGFSSDLTSLAVVEYLEDATAERRLSSQVSILRLPTLELATRIPIKMVRPTSPSTDGRRLVFADPDNLYLWDFAQAAMVWQVPQQKAMLTAFSTDRTMIAVSDKNREILIRDAVDGTIRMRCPNMRLGTHKVLFAPDGRTLISASHSIVRFTHIATGQELLQLTLPGGVHRIEFSPDGKRLICQITPPKMDALQKPDEIVIIDASEVTMERSSP